MGQNHKASLAATEDTKVTGADEERAEDDPSYAACADGWPRILSRLKTSYLRPGRLSSRMDTTREWSDIFRPDDQTSTPNSLGIPPVPKLESQKNTAFRLQGRWHSFRFASDPC